MDFHDANVFHKDIWFFFLSFDRSVCCLSIDILHFVVLESFRNNISIFFFFLSLFFLLLIDLFWTMDKSRNRSRDTGFFFFVKSFNKLFLILFFITLNFLLLLYYNYIIINSEWIKIGIDQEIQDFYFLFFLLVKSFNKLYFLFYFLNSLF